ncbi:MAG: ATP-binding protein [Rhodospirillales bacterium]
MYNKFVKTSNVERFLGAVGSIEDRGAPEACIILVDGDAGLGKSRTGQWWAIKNNAVQIRIKAAATPHWVLTDLVRELGEQAPATSCEKLYGQAIGYLLKDPRPIVVDEVENGLRDIRVLETIRDLVESAEIPTAFVGREYVLGKLKAYKHFSTRIGARAEFSLLTLNDVTLCVKELCEVDVPQDVIEQIHAESNGHVREVVKAIKAVERIGKRNKGAVSMDLIGGQRLVYEHMGRKRAA